MYYVVTKKNLAAYTLLKDARAERREEMQFSKLAKLVIVITC